MVADGSNPENLDPSRCFPLCPRKRTLPARPGCAGPWRVGSVAGVRYGGTVWSLVAASLPLSRGIVATTERSAITSSVPSSFVCFDRGIELGGGDVGNAQRGLALTFGKTGLGCGFLS
jgi:hypothetical protein